MRTTLLLLACSTLLAACTPDAVGRQEGESGDEPDSGDTDSSFDGRDVSVGGVSVGEGGFRFSVEREDTLIEIQLERGGRRDQDLLDRHPELSEYESDVRVLDAGGLTFVSAIAGDDWVNPDWGTDYWNATGGGDVNRDSEFELLAGAADKIGELTLPDFDVEIGDVAAIARFHDLGRMKAELSAADLEEPSEPPPPSATYSHYAAQFSASRWWGSYDHSGVYAMAYTGSLSSPSIRSTVLRGNHGALPTDSAMSLYCSKSWSGRTSTTLYAAPYTDNSYGTSQGGGCSTSYGAIFDNGNHVCNDDSHAEYGNVKNNSYSVWAVCSDNDLNLAADSCSSI